VSRTQNQSTITAVLALTAIAAAALVFVAIPAIILELASAWATIRYPPDPSAGDAMGWGFVIAAPIFLAIDLGVSVGIGVVIFHRLRDRRGRGDSNGPLISGRIADL
jgi:hypothetical protein